MFSAVKKAASLAQRTASAMNTFTATLANLNAINEEAVVEDNKLKITQEELQKERDQLQKMIESNSKIAKKIEAFLS
jgi:septal ring factor EnvC (AmiA/AmiB activator)